MTGDWEWERMDLAEDKRREAEELIERGLRETAAIGNPVARLRHRASWALRVSALDPERAEAMADDLGESAEAQSRLLLTAVTDRALRGETDLRAGFERTLQATEGTEADTRLRVVNSLCEIAIEVAEQDRAGAADLLRPLAPVVRGLTVPEAEFQQLRVLGLALLGEALLVLDEPLGRELLDEAVQECESACSREPIVAFIANALAARDPAEALRLIGTLQDPSARLDARLQLAVSAEDAAVRDELFALAEADAWIIEHYHGPEVIVRVASVLGAVHPEKAGELFRKALAAGEANGPQMRSLQWTGIASAVAPIDREWALSIFQDAVAAAREEAETVRRVTSLALIANEMADQFPREASEVFSEAMQDALQLEAMWELAHLNDVVFRSDRSEFLDVAPALPVLERALARLADDDPRIPGVFGLAEVAQSISQIDRGRGAEVLERWMRAAEASSDTDAMSQAALTIYRSDPERGVQALTVVRDLLLRRIDCPSMGEFSRTAADAAPELVLSVAPHIPDRRERADAVAAAAVGLYPVDAGRSLELVGSLERPVERSAALMRIVDRVLNTTDRQEPEPLMEDLP